jgi:predicted DNA-binding transcriptional regulator AlpA
MTESTNPNIQFLTAADLSKLLRLAKRTIFRLKSSGKLPQPIKIGGAAIRWRESDIALWQEKGCPDQKTFEALKGVSR